MRESDSDRGRHSEGYRDRTALRDLLATPEHDSVHDGSGGSPIPESRLSVRTAVGFATLNGGPVTSSRKGEEQHAFPSWAPATVLCIASGAIAGHPAIVGFLLRRLDFVLTAKLRSDGDYGVTIGDSDSGPGRRPKVCKRLA